MRIVFMGASELGWTCCRSLLEMGQEVVGIFSIPPTFRISWSSNPVKNVRFKSFEDLADAYDIPLVYVTKKMADPEYREALKQLKPDILIVIGWYYMVPRSLRQLATLGAVGMHASLLPKYRGGAPLVWAVINGETQAGISFFHFEDGVDDGDLIAQTGFEIGLEDTISDVVHKSSEAAIELIREYVPQLAAGRAPRLAQDHSQATEVPQRKPEDGLLDWHSQSAMQAYNWVRAQTRPYPGAFTYLGQEKVTLWEAGLSPDVCKEIYAPGTIAVDLLRDLDTFGVYCADGRILHIYEIGLSDGASMSGAEFLAAQKAIPGMQFSNTETDVTLLDVCAMIA